MGFEYMYNIKEGSWDEELSKTTGSVLSPKNHNVRLWNLLIALTSLMAFSVSMFQVFFNGTVQSVNTIKYGLDLIYFLYIVSRFFIGFEENGVVITDAKQIRRRYLHTWFFVDVCSLIPLELLAMANPALYVLNLNCCLRVLTLFGIIASFAKEPDTNKIHVTALNSFCIMVICIQSCACVWYYNVCAGTTDTQIRNCINTNSWLQLFPEVSTNLTGISDMKLFGNAIYWAVISLSGVGYGDVYAVSPKEVEMACLVMVVGLLAFGGVIMTGMTSIISNLDAQRGRFYNRMEAIRMHMRHMGLPQELQTWVYKYYYYLWIHRKGNTIAGLWDDLPYTLRSEIATECYKPLLKKGSIFDNTDDGFLRALHAKFSTSTYSPGQILAKPGEINKNAYYIENGLVQVHGDNEEKMATLLPGSFIGEVYLLFKIPRNTTISASTLCEICVLEHKCLISLLADYPEVGLMIARAARKRLHNVKYPLSEAFALGLASNPRSVIVHQTSNVDLKPKDQRILNLFMDFMSHQLKNAPSLSKSSTDEQKVLGIPTLRPDDRFVKSWDIAVFWCFTVSIFTETWLFFFANNLETKGFYYNNWGLVYLLLSVLIDIVALIDIFINLRTEVITKDGYLSDITAIFSNYQKSWDLYFDILAIFPFDLLSFMYSGEFHWRNLTYCRLNRLLWIRKVYMYFKRKEEDLDNNLFVQRTAKCIFLLLISLHCCSGCLYFAGCTQHRCDENSWAWEIGLKESQSNFYHYMMTVYWAATTMTNIGFGDILPSNMTERIVAAMVGLIGLFIFNYLVSQIYATLSSKNASRVTFQNLLSSVTLFMEHQNLSISLQKRVRDYMSLLWSKYQGEAYPGGPFLMHDLPTELQQIVLMEERGQLLSKIPFFEQAGPSFIRDIASVAVMYFFPRGEIIQYSDTITRELFCVHRGTCQILTDDLSDIVALYGEGMYFGEVGFMFSKQAVMTVRAKTHCEILSIDYEKIKPVLERYPIIKRQFERLQNKTDYYNRIVDAVEGLMRSKHRPLEEDVTHRKKDSTFAYEGRRYAKKSKCYIEDFGNFPIYAGAEEETIEERLLKLSKTRMIPRKPRTYLEHMKEFFFRSCPSFILMRNAILPSNATYIRWEFSRICVAIAISILSLLLFSFLHKEQWVWIILYSLGGFCWIDIYIRMHVAFYKDNHLQVDTLETAKHYLKTSFLLDFISCFPWEIIGLMYFNINTIALWDTRPEILHIFAYLRVPHILQLYRVPLAFSFLQSEITTEKTAVTFFKFFLYTSMFLHFCTCIVFAIACPPADIDGDPELYLLPLGKHNCSRLSWVNHLDYSFDVVYDNVTFTQLYAISLYFATTTLCGVGYGDIHPYLTSMRIAMIFIMVAGALYIGFLSGTVASILANADATRAAFIDKKDSIKLFLKSQKITGNLFFSILDFYAFKWIRTKGVNQDIVFEYLPSSLLGDVSTIIYADVIAKSFGLKVKRKRIHASATQPLSALEKKLSGKLGQPFFQEVLRKESVEQLETDAGFIRLLASQIRPCLFRAGDIICKRNEYGAEMYFIDKGEVDVLSIDESSVIVTLKSGQHFGEGCLLFSEPRATTIRAASNCDLFILSKASLDEAIVYYPNICKEIKQSAQRKQEELFRTSAISQKKKVAKCKDFSAVDRGYIKFYKDLMENDHKKKYHKPTFKERYVLNIFSNFWMRLLKFHNSTVDPGNPIRMIYQYTSCILLVILFWSVTYMPITYKFNQNTYAMVMVIEYIQLFEIIFKFHIAYHDKQGTYITNYGSVSRNYLFGKLGYLFDVLASFPYGMIALHSIDETSTLEFLGFLINLRLGYVPRILSTLIFMRDEEKSIGTNLLVIRITKYLIQGAVFVHITAVLFVLLTANSDRQPSFFGDLEILYFHLKYLYGAYWTLATYTTTGYGDIHPRRFSEMLFTILIMFMAKMHVIYNMGVLSSSQTNKQSLQVAFEEKLQAVEAYMIDRNIPSNLHNRVTHFYNYIWTRTKGIQSDILFQDTPHCMKNDIFSRICIHLLKKQQLFAHLSDTFLHHLASKMHLISYTAGEYIKRRGDVGVGMWLIIFGSVKVNRHENKGDYYKSVSTGSILGLHLLFKRKLCGFSAVAENYVDIFYLTKDSFDEICSYYPVVTKRLYKRAYNYASVPL